MDNGHYDMGTRRAAMWDKCVHGQRALETMPGRGQEAVMLADSSITSWKVKDTLYFGDGLSFFFFVIFVIYFGDGLLAEFLEMRYFGKLDPLEEGERR